MWCAREQTRRVMSKSLKAGVKFALATDLNHTLLWLADEIGTLEAGKCADIISVDGDPLEDISALSRVRMVMRGGCVVKHER